MPNQMQKDRTRTAPGATPHRPGARAATPPRNRSERRAAGSGVREGSTMDAVIKVLRRTRGGSLTLDELYDRMEAQGLTSHLQGKTPRATLSAQVCMAAKKNRYVERVGKGRYALIGGGA